MPDLRPYQSEGIGWLKERPRALLADEPGLGKSAQLLGAAVEPILVVAPAMVLDGGTWDDEIAKWAPGADVTQVPYSSLTDRERTSKGGTRPVGRPRAEYRRPWGTVILDESHYIKGRDTTWTQAAQMLQADRLYQATGTPIPNWASELFTSLQLLYPEESRPGGRYGSYWRWARRWFNVYEMWGGLKVGRLLECAKPCTKMRWPEVCEHWKEFHDRNLGDLFLQRLRDDVLTDLPPLTVVRIELDMSPAQRRAYDSLKRDYLAVLESGKEVVTWSKAAQYVQMVKLCTGPELLDRSIARHSPKFAELARRVADQARPSLVVGHFRSTVEIAAQACRKAGASVEVVHGGTSSPDRRKAIRAFQAGGVDVLAASIDTVREGLTLTQADTVHRLERSHRPSSNEQVIRRIHRIGQIRPVTVVDYVTKNSLDLRIIKHLSHKTDQQLKALRPHEVAALL